MSRYVLGWVLAASLLLPVIAPATAAAEPTDSARITILTESGPGISILLNLMARFLGPSGSVIDPNGKPPDNSTRPQVPGSVETKANSSVTNVPAGGSLTGFVSGNPI